MLSDFGRSRIIGQRGFTTKFAGTVGYMAPELITDESEHPEITLASDVYAFAITGAEVHISIVRIEHFPNSTTDSYRSTSIHWIRLWYSE